MTTGMIILLDKKGTIRDRTYLSSDAYLSFGGHEVFTAFAEGREDTLFDPEGRKMLDGITHEWYKEVCVRSSKEADYNSYPDYSYEIQGDTLKVYHFGRQFMTAERNDMKKWLWLSEGDNESMLYDFLFYRPKQLGYSVPKDYMAKLADFVADNDPDTLKRVRSALPKELITLDDSHCLAPSGADRAYRKRLAIGKHVIDFIVTQDHFDGRWRIYVQLPFVRAPFTPAVYRTEAAAVDFIRNYINDSDSHVMRLKNTSEVIGIYEEIRRMIEGKEVSQDLSGLLGEKLNGYRTEHSEWLFCESTLSPTQLIRELMNAQRTVKSA